MLVYNKKNWKLSIKIIGLVIAITIILTVVLYYLPIITPFVIWALIFWIYFEKEISKENFEVLYSRTNEIKHLLYGAYAKDWWCIDGIVKDFAVEELMQEYKEKHEWNIDALNKLKWKDSNKKIEDIVYYKTCLNFAATIYDSMLTHSKDIIPEHKLEEWLAIATTKFEEYKKYFKKKAYSLKDLIEVKDIIDSTLYFWERMVLDPSRYNIVRTGSSNICIDLNKNFNSNEVDLGNHPICYYFRTE